MSNSDEEISIGEPTAVPATSGATTATATSDSSRDEGAASSAAGETTEEHTDAQDGSVGQRLAGWWEARAKPGLKTLGDGITRGVKDSGRRFTVIRQRLKEQLGQTTKTIDVDLQPKIDNLKGLKQEYQQLADAAKGFATTVAAASHVKVVCESCIELCSQLSFYITECHTHPHTGPGSLW